MMPNELDVPQQAPVQEVFHVGPHVPNVVDEHVDGLECCIHHPRQLGMLLDHLMHVEPPTPEIYVWTHMHNSYLATSSSR